MANIWRNKRRSSIVIISVIIGLISLIITDSLSMGFLNQMLNNQIKSNLSHIQIHKKGFNDNKVIQNYINNSQKVETVLKNNSNVEHYSERIVTFGLLSSASNSAGVLINGIVPEQEKSVTNISELIKNGRYLSGKRA